jgi:uncharacterized protein YbjT (DUF2867 family)
MILVVGATGLLGRETSLRLLSLGEPVRALTRRPAQAADLAGAGAELVAGDLLDPASLARACQGVDRVFAAAHGLLGRGQYRSEAVDDAGHRSLVDAARAAGVRRFVYTSVFRAAANHPVDFWRTKHRVERHLEASGMEWTMLRPTAFMEVHAQQLIGRPILGKGRVSILGRGTKPRNFVAVRDVVHFATMALVTDRLLGRRLDIGGPDNVSSIHVAGLYGELAGVRPRLSHLSPRMTAILGRVLQPVHPGIARVMRMSSLPDDAFDECFDPAALRAEFPLELTSLRDFVVEQVRENAAGRSP